MPCSQDESGLNAFDEIADVYDELVNWAPYDKWVRDLERRLRRCGLRRGGRVLDAACGTGLSTIPWAERGYVAVGVDRCEPMLGAARSKVEGTGLAISFVRGDLLALGACAPFDLAVCMHSGLDYILEPDLLAQAFGELRRVLRPGGLLSFDKCLDEPDFYRKPYSNTRSITGGEAVFHYSWDRGRRLFDQHCTVRRAGPDGGMITTQFLHRMMAVPLDELIRMVERAGFELLEKPRQFSISDPGMGIFRAL